MSLIIASGVGIREIEQYCHERNISRRDVTPITTEQDLPKLQGYKDREIVLLTDTWKIRGLTSMMNSRNLRRTYA